MPPTIQTSSGGLQSWRYASYWNAFLFNGTAIRKFRIVYIGPVEHGIANVQWIASINTFHRVSFITVRNEVAKVMFLQACVCPTVGGSTWPGTPPWDQVHPPGTRYTPLDQVQPPRTRYTHQPGAPPRPGYTPRTRYTPWTGTPPRPGTPPHTRYTPPDRYTPRQLHPPRDTATAADGTHPTGMHSCSIL